jgi:hypothetical protein
MRVVSRQRVNGCDTCNDILKRDLTKEVFKAGSNCLVQTGVVADPYTGKIINFVRGVKTSTAVQIDHVVALGDTWRTGRRNGRRQRGSATPTTRWCFLPSTNRTTSHATSTKASASRTEAAERTGHSCTSTNATFAHKHRRPHHRVSRQGLAQASDLVDAVVVAAEERGLQVGSERAGLEGSHIWAYPMANQVWCCGALFVGQSFEELDEVENFDAVRLVALGDRPECALPNSSGFIPYP